MVVSLLPAWNAPVNMIYKEMNFPIGHNSMNHLMFESAFRISLAFWFTCQLEGTTAIHMCQILCLNASSQYFYQNLVD